MTPSAAFRFVPLWPFGSVADAARWQREALPGGHQPWRLDAGSTALAFVSAHLRYPGIDEVTSRREAGSEAWVGVGGTSTEGRSTAAVVHLARIGTGALRDRPWEVVGTEDTALTITAPRYGAVVGSTFTAGGRITGVDESLTVQVRAGDRLLGGVVGLSAGGTDQPWRATVSIDARQAVNATVAVATGGHVQQVERFAITGVRVRPDARAVATYPTAAAALATTVVRGTYLGDCAGVAPGNAVRTPVCSTLVHASADRFLYRVGEWRTDNGCFVLLRQTSRRWQVVDANLPGALVPPDLGGPITEP